MDGWMDGCVDGRVLGWMNGWMDVWGGGCWADDGRDGGLIMVGCGMEDAGWILGCRMADVG